MYVVASVPDFVKIFPLRAPCKISMTMAYRPISTMAIASPIVDVSSTTTATIYPYVLYEVLGRQSRIVVAVRGLYDALDVHYNLTYQNIHTLDTKNYKRRHLKELMPQRAQYIIHIILKNTLRVYLVIKISK